MIKNSEVDKLIKEKFKEMEVHLNSLERELENFGNESDSINKSKIKLGILYGKITKLFADAAYLLGIFDDKPKNVGATRT